MKALLLRSFGATLLLVLVAACSSGPQQPSDIVDDRSGDSPHLGGGSELDTSAETGLDSLGGGTDPIVTGSVAADVTSISGGWATNPEACGNAGAMVVVSANRVERPGKTCEVADRLDSGNSSVTMTLTCPVGPEGETESEFVKLSPQDDDSLVLSVVGGDEAPQTLSRCP
jgi:hypothetical protein